jgi:hypothetical protein
VQRFAAVGLAPATSKLDFLLMSHAKAVEALLCRQGRPPTFSSDLVLLLVMSIFFMRSYMYYSSPYLCVSVPCSRAGIETEVLRSGDTGRRFSSGFSAS